ncbi:DUF2267 domain-containing protein [Natronococcus sp. A-GB1]|uniref:DUF2267 domain-containing protein n=1 Tax=Natronococcus sp. A-GB1 TaxID=3037648 RepID=UPI00241D7E40|nr:DUF2267 domain-containing protein [Natronococcus sp. A-GB1]MDG5761701.1 DUF2267 domain-containing protein [Natronococcus sp. A-GB1]
MQYDDFTSGSQQRTQLDSREAALSVSRATLTTLSERVGPGQAENVGARLPDELARFLEEGVTGDALEDVRTQLPTDEGYDDPSNSPKATAARPDRDRPVRRSQSSTAIITSSA